MKKTFIIGLVFFGLCANADEVTQALSETQNLLRDPSRIKNEALNTPEAQTADRNASIVTLGKPELKQELYNISADLMSWIVEASQGDPAKMQQMMSDALSNPKSLYDRMPASERSRVKALSEKIEGSRKNPYP